MKEPPLLEIDNATIWRGSTRVFHDFSLTLQQHERVAILGPNGAGKTTLLKLINRELYPVASDDSWVRILGRERWNVWELREHIGLVSPDLQSHFMPNSTVLEVIVSGFFSSIGVHYQLREHIQPMQLQKSVEVMQMLGLKEFREREFETLSTGQQRRCLLGRALVHDPDTLVLDEPTSGLDLKAGFEYLSRIRELARRGRSLVIVTHHLDEIPPEIERVIILKNGQIKADGPRDAVLTAEVLSDVYDTSLRVAHVDGHFMVYPAENN
ncbi:MAG: ATP-binding cassette domain-containing protein [Xanthomonadales bacterium]|mgnify:CR=1 FL=1|nr:ATP-binding cassette domain-containing protein [Xanthomonadales bacterium]MDH4001109.1 ATP-binding cassette domain-containing protein [Xanthomonadales bacterium]